MRCAIGVSVAGAALGEVLYEEFLKPLGLTVNALALCRNDCSTARRLDGGAGQGLVLLNRVNATDLLLLVRPSARLVSDLE